MSGILGGRSGDVEGGLSSGFGAGICLSLDGTVWRFAIVEKVVGGRLLKGSPSFSFSRVYFDTRRIVDGSDGVFWALVGHRDGHVYVKEAWEKGVRGFVCRSDWEGRLPELPDSHVLLVEDTWEALFRLARYSRCWRAGRVYLVAGTHGKTIVKEWLYSALAGLGKGSVYRSPQSWNSQLGGALSLVHLVEGTEVALLESEVECEEDVGRWVWMALPDGVVLTHVALEVMGRRGGVFRRLVEGVPRVWLKEELLPVVLSEGDWSRKEVYCWGRSDRAWLRVEEEWWAGDGYRVRCWDGGAGTWEIHLPFRERFLVEDALTVVLFLRWLGVVPSVIRGLVRRLMPLRQRVEFHSGIGGLVVVEDLWSSDVPALRNALEVMVVRSGGGGGGRGLLLTPLEDPSYSREELPDVLCREVVRFGLDRLILYGWGGEEVERMRGCAREVWGVRDVESVRRLFVERSWEGYVLVVKVGSRYRGELEPVLRFLEESPHLTRLDVHLQALLRNVQIYRGLVPRGVGMLVMVKALAYGGGDIEVARTLAYAGVDALGVAYVSEGKRLRQGGIDLPILVFQGVDWRVQDWVVWRLEPVLSSFWQVERILAQLRDDLVGASWLPVPVHIEVDTGFHRLGFLPEEVPRLLDMLEGFRGKVEVRSVFSHLVGSERPELDGFTRRQAELFLRVAEVVRCRWGGGVRRHLLNSAGIVRFPEYVLEMVRPGIGIYGVDPTGRLPVEPVYTLRATVLAVRRVGVGESVGYGRVFCACRPMEVAVLSVGYGDGLPVHVGARGSPVWINQRVYRYVGQPCMDVSFVDVTGCGDSVVLPGMEAVVFGRELPVEVLARTLSWTPYHLLSGVTGRVPRVYVLD